MKFRKAAVLLLAALAVHPMSIPAAQGSAAACGGWDVTPREIVD